jgi:hypothetical protein
MPKDEPALMVSDDAAFDFFIDHEKDLVGEVGDSFVFAYDGHIERQAII